MDCNRTDDRPIFSVRFSWLLILVVSVTAMMPGCSGCRQTSPAAKKKKEDKEKKKKADKEKKKPKPDFQFMPVRVQPTDVNSNFNYVKPGHWTSAVQPVIANNFNFHGELETAVRDNKDQPIPLANTRFQLATSRPTNLPKGQIKFIDTVYHVPEYKTDSGDAKQVRLYSRLRSSNGVEVFRPTVDITSYMPAYQYYFVVLAAKPDQYNYLGTLPSISPAHDPFRGSTQTLFYRVVAPQIKGPRGQAVLLPANPLAWSSIAYVLWDELNPDDMTLGQKRAMTDWLHLGGQLIISGPTSLDMLQKSELLGPHLPVKKTDTVELTQADFGELNDRWSLSDAKTSNRLTLKTTAMLGVKWKLVGDGTEMSGTGGLVAERRVGRGRIVVTAFPLTSRQVVNWGSFDSFFNGCLLRRPARRFRKIEVDLTSGDPNPSFQWAKHTHDRYVYDSRFSTTFRIFSRDIGLPASVQSTSQKNYEQEVAENTPRRQTGMIFPQDEPAPIHDRYFGDHPSDDSWHFQGYGDLARQHGVGRWNDTRYASATSAARLALKDAAGISIPKADFVYKALAAYLFVLVPLNWIVFRCIGRVEWAWIAAPVIAIVGAVAVVRMVQLDIGFVRSRTEIGILEVHGGYPRAHLTRYTALYTSLSTGFNMKFRDPGALALPLANPDFNLGFNESPRTVHFHRANEVGLTGFQVNSNSTGMVHSEEVYRLNGSISLEGNLTNGLNVRNGSS